MQRASRGAEDDRGYLGHNDSFSFGGGQGRSSASGRPAPPGADAQTAAQLLKLQRLVESLVVRELERAPGSGAAAAGGGSHQQRGTQHQPAAYPPTGPGAHRSQRRPSSVSSEASSLVDFGPPAPSGGRSGGGGGGGGGNAARAAGTRSGYRGLGDDGVPMQVAALQGQLAVLGEQLNSAYRAADGVSSPRATLLRTQQQQQHAAAAQGGYRGGLGVDAGGGMGPPSPGAQGGLGATFGRPVTPPAAVMPGRGAYHLGAAGTAAAGDLFGDGAGGLGLGVLGGGIGGGGGGGGVARDMRQLAAEERAGREASAREDERLRGWIQDLRSERRRLEDRLLDGDPSGGRVQAMRDDLEKQVLSLSRQRDQVAAELSELGITRGANAQLAAQVEALELALATESDRVARYKEVRPALEARLAEVSSSLEALKQQHAATLEVMAQERDAAALKARRNGKRASELEATLSATQADVRRLEEEVRGHAVALSEARASNEVIQAAGNQLQASMESQARDAAARLAALQSQLEASSSDCGLLRRQLEAAQAEAAAVKDQLRDAQTRLESLTAERDRLVSALAEEQRAAAAARQQADSLNVQVKAGEEARAEASRGFSLQLETLRRQHAADLAAVQKQYESQLAAAEKQYLLLQRQYDAGLTSNDKVAETASTLRRERDALWAEAENLKAELEEARKEKAEVGAKLNALRGEVRTTMEEVTRDRDARLAAVSGQGEALVRDIRVEAERRVAAVQHEYETRLAGLMDVTEKLRAEATDSQRQADKHKATVSHLKDQVRDLLLSRDAAERELASERAFNEELNRILSDIRAEQQQQAVALEERAY
ncbi:hypothetical protein CHLRE_04g222500v5 [Chlamydomonas reinhardtii]|uniref:Uncharacterized protein n=1 Tax=Chlamydomonas reinhardtii TaxID=3055 RepID=A0A2K3DUC7_CHLRE|nr:uncharacterized protein CHLRE_04g222500v5 [Chlamydomonas reinhardtii]PNW84136.1 hypothetical protein CHLRE_04g222500v5 [Chlamydomonas reinhardtii]